MEEKRGIGNKILIGAIVVVSVLIVVSLLWIFYSVDDFVGEEVEEEEVFVPTPIDEVCATACNDNQRDVFCFHNRRAADNLVTTCYELATNPDYSQYNVDECPEFSCERTSEELNPTCKFLGGEWVFPRDDGSCPPTEIKRRSQANPSEEPPEEGKICCR